MNRDRRFSLPALLAALACCAMFAALGAWQLGRAAFKERLLEAYNQALQQTAVPLRAVVDAGELRIAHVLVDPLAVAGTPVAVRDLAPLRAIGRGRFDVAVTLLLDNQVLDGRAGVMVLGLFHPQGGEKALLVNRGWLPLPPDRTLPHIAPLPTDDVEISGLLAAPPSTGLKLGNAHAPRGAAAPAMLNYLDVDALSGDLKTSLFRGVLLLDRGHAYGFTRQWQALPNTMPPERHRGYAFTWFALALTSLVVFGVLTWKAARR